MSFIRKVMPHLITVGGSFLFLLRLALAGERAFGRRREAVVGLVPQAPRIVQAAHLGEQQRLHFRELGGVMRVGGEVDLMLRGRCAGQRGDFAS